MYVLFCKVLSTIAYMTIFSKFTVTDLGGTKRMRQGGQLYQSSYLPLQTPYTIFGLGRTSNYIEDFAYGITSNEVGVVLGDISK